MIIGQYMDNSVNAAVTLVYGTFACNGASAPTKVHGRGYTVARTGTGEYTLTLEAPAANLMAGKVSRIGPAATVSALHFKTVTGVSSATPTLVIGNSPAGVATDLAAGDSVSFALWLSTDAGLSP